MIYVQSNENEGDRSYGAQWFTDNENEEANVYVGARQASQIT